MQFNGPAIRALRKCQRITQVELAKAARVSQGHIANVEAGRDRLKEPKARLVARALGLADLRAIMGPDDLPDAEIVP